MEISIRGNGILAVANPFDVFTVKTDEAVLMDLCEGLIGLRDGEHKFFKIAVADNEKLCGQLEDGVLQIARCTYPCAKKMHIITNYKAKYPTDIILDEMITVLQRALM